MPILAEIERNGFLLDVVALHGLSKEVEGELDRITETIAGLAGGEFNINSPKQLATVFFEKLGLKPGRKTKTGYSTDEDTLTQLAAQHELPSQILNCRSLSKLKSTYVTPCRLCQARNEAPAYLSESDRRRDRAAFFHRPESSKHPGERRLRVAHS